MVEQRASKRQQELLSFVDGFIKGNGYGPSYREIMRALDYKSVSTVATHIENLITKGYLARRDKSARSLEVVTLRPEAPVAAPSITREVESQLLDILKDIELTPEQRNLVAEAFELIHMNKVSDAIKQTQSTKKTS